MSSSIDFLGIAAMAMIAILAALTVAGIIFGMRLKRRRVAAEREIEERREAADLPEAPTPEAPTSEEADAGAPPSKGEPVNVEQPSASDAKVPDQRPAKPLSEPEPGKKPAAKQAAPQTDTPPSTASAPQASKPDGAAPSTAGAITGDIGQIKGLGPKLAALLADLGYTRVGQIAALTPEQAAALDAKLGAFQGRMARDQWIEQATLLSAGDQAGYEAKFGKLG